MDAKMLDGKVAIVSGASYGMGLDMAQLFAKEGAKVVITRSGEAGCGCGRDSCTGPGSERRYGRQQES